MNVPHTSDPTCPSCETKLCQAHVSLRDWFHKVKAANPNVHISWSYRGQEDQEKAFQEGKSKLHYPDSAHNKVGQDEQPCARALDLFQIDEDGVARFSPPFYAKLAAQCLDDRDPIRWGGTFKSLGDKDHFELASSSAVEQLAVNQ
jgi:hypothetical protein